MIDLKELKNDALKFPEPLRSILQMQKETMTEQDFSEFVINLLKKARELDNRKEPWLKNNGIPAKNTTDGDAYMKNEDKVFKNYDGK